MRTASSLFPRTVGRSRLPSFVTGRPSICGIVNITPDSFSDGGYFRRVPDAVEHALQLVRDGADILDIGGESTRPGARAVSVGEELKRVLPVVTELANRVNVPLSVDTSRPEVMRAAVEAGATIINDVRGLRMPGALEAAAELSVPVCLMHTSGDASALHAGVDAVDVVAAVRDSLEHRRRECIDAGIDSEHILLDPGFGFGKTVDQNFALLDRLELIADLGSPVLVGLSRKSMIGFATGNGVHQREFGSVVAAAVAVQKGASIVRVHDVRATVEGLAVLYAIGRRKGKWDRTAAAESFDIP